MGKISIGSILFLILIGCAEQAGPVYQADSQVGPLVEQQLAAYPTLENNRYMTLINFESARDLEYFELVRTDVFDPDNTNTNDSDDVNDGEEADVSQSPPDAGKAKEPVGYRLLYSASPTATGSGALGVALDDVGDYALSFTPPIRRWKRYNRFLCAVFIEELRRECQISLIDGQGKTAEKPFSLSQGWNKLEIDLSALRKDIDLENIVGVKCSFHLIGGTTLFFDDFILVDDRRSIYRTSP